MNCPKCGTELPDCAVYCSKCGSRTSVMSLKEKVLYQVLLFTEVLKIHKKKIIAAALVLVVLFVSGITTFEVTKVKVPSLKNKTIVEAKELLEPLGFKEKNIEAYDTNDDKLKSLTDERFVVVSQSVKPGERIHGFDGLTLVCEDSYARFDEDIQEALYERYETGYAIADDNGYSVSLRDDSGQYVDEPVTNFDKNDLIITGIQGIQHKWKRVEFLVVSEKDEQDKWINLLKRYEDKNAEIVVDAVTERGYDFELEPISKDKYPDSGDMTTGREFLFLKHGDIDVPGRTIGLSVVSLKQKRFEKKEKKLLKALKSKIPYVGLKEDYINKSKVGKADSYTEKGDYDEKHVYKWKSDDGDYVPLIVTCMDNKVTKVSKKYKYAYWKNTSTPDFSADKDAIDKARAAKRSQSSSGSTRSISRSSGGISGGSDTMVWVPRTGSKYHSNPYCSGMVNPSEMPLSQAKIYYGACKKCYG